eukprot:9488551-Pyramimonas_sp.AAC.1
MRCCRTPGPAIGLITGAIFIRTSHTGAALRQTIARVIVVSRKRTKSFSEMLAGCRFLIGRFLSISCECRPKHA